MASTSTDIVRLSELVDGQEGEFFAALVKRDEGTDKHGNRYYKCHFRDKHALRVAPIWSSDPLLPMAAEWNLHVAFRIKARAENSKYGPQIKILECRQVVDADVNDGYSFSDLVESSKYNVVELHYKIGDYVERNVKCPHIRQLIRVILDRHGDLLKMMPAAQNFHHSFSGGLIEHLWSVTVISHQLARHYSRYYDELNPPLNCDVVIAAALLHDIGKLRELSYHVVETKYTKHGTLIGHIVLGRDMIRDTAREIEGFPDETLMLLEHAVLAHHGIKEYGAPVEPHTIEALIVHYADEIDAKINAAASERIRSNTEGDFTARVFAVGNRAFYKGIPIVPAIDDRDGPP